MTTASGCVMFAKMGFYSLLVLILIQNSAPVQVVSPSFKDTGGSLKQSKAKRAAYIPPHSGWFTS